MLYCYCTTCNKFTETANIKKLTFMDEEMLDVVYLGTCEVCGAPTGQRRIYINEEINSLSMKEIEDYTKMGGW